MAYTKIAIYFVNNDFVAAGFSLRFNLRRILPANQETQAEACAYKSIYYLMF
jgi:hypothetical protein